MDYGSIIKFVKNEYGHCYDNAAFYSEIANWLDWYKGYVPSVHVVKVSNGLNIQERKIFRLRMAKRVCEDWASSLLNEGIKFVVSNQKSSVFLQGSKGNRGVLGSNNFEVIVSDLVEQAFALGTGAIVVELSNIGVSSDGTAISNSESQIKIKIFNGTRILPISYSNGIVTECAFLSEITIDNKKFYLVSAHLLSDAKEYVIHNTLLDGNYKKASLPDGYLPFLNTHSKLPLFYIFKPNIANNIDLDSPMGLSIYSESIDNLTTCDVIFDSCIREVITGQRIVMMNKMLLTTDEQGKPIAPQDVKQTYMQFFGDDATSDIKEYIKEFHPTLNTSALDDELQNQLNLLSDKCGLGVGYYQFNGQSVKTATEYIGNRNDFQRNVKKMTNLFKDNLQKLASVILFLGNNALGLSVDANTKIVVEISDGVIESDTDERIQDREDVKQGIMTKAEYRAKWYGETLDAAQEKLSQINNSNINNIS